MNQEASEIHAPAGVRIFTFTLAAFAAWAFVAFATPAMAQDEGAGVWRRGGCANCHGGIGQGGGGGEDPAGPNLHESDLDRDALWETIACGRGPMPFNLAGAYLEVPCYGIPVGPPPEGFEPGARISAEDLDILADFLMEFVVGTRVDRTACAAFYRGDLNARTCAQFPR